MLLSGIFPPITTPFYPDGKVYYKKLEANLERYSRTPVAGIVVLGSTGEAICSLTTSVARFSSQLVPQPPTTRF